LALAVDVADADALFAARDTVVEAWDGIDVWVNAAMATVVGPVEQIRPEEFRRVTEVTYLGAVHGTLAALAAMRAANRGVIVQVGSALAYRAIPLQSAYCAAKFAVRGFTDALRCELEHEGSRVRLSMVQLPGVNTPQFDWARNKMPRKYGPVSDVYQPEVAARAIFRAACDHPRELWVARSAIQAIFGQHLLPRWLDRRLAEQGWDGQLQAEAETPGRPDNLFAPVPGPVGAHGRFTARAKAAAWILDPDRARLAVLGLSGGFAGFLLGRRLGQRGGAP